MSRIIDNLTVRGKLVTNEIQSIFNSSVNQRSTNIQADNISCNTISYVNGPAGGNAITYTEINTTPYEISSIDYTYYFIKNTGNTTINLTNLNISQLGKVFYVFYSSPISIAINFTCGVDSYIMQNINVSLFSGETIPTINYLESSSLNVTTAVSVKKNYLFRFTPVINDDITYYYVDEYYPN